MKRNNDFAQSKRRKKQIQNIQLSGETFSIVNTQNFKIPKKNNLIIINLEFFFSNFYIF